MATLSNNDIARAIYLVLKDSHLEALPPLGGKASKYNKIVQFLVRKRLLPQTRNILDRLDKIINQENGRIVVKVLSAQKLKEESKKELTFFLKERYKAKEIILTEILDKKLLGGIRLEINDEIIDITVKNKIKKLQEYLTKKV